MKDLFAGPILSWLPGAIFMVMVGGYGAFAAYSIIKNKNLELVKRYYKPAYNMSILMIVIGTIAFVMGQPYAIWYGFQMPGLVGFLILLFNRRILYTEIDSKKE